MDLARFRSTKVYDFLAALPLILWYGYAVRQQLPVLRELPTLFDADLLSALRTLAVFGSGMFYLVVVVALIVRAPPVERSLGILPRAVAFLGTFLSVAILRLPVAVLPLGVQVVANGSIFMGCVASALIVWALGRNFSVFPEARGLVTTGPYAWARHPLYTAESLIVIGTAIQFAQPWAGVLGVVNLALIYARTVYEERVLALAHPEYAAYRARTARFLPGVF